MAFSKKYRLVLSGNIFQTGRPEVLRISILVRFKAVIVTVIYQIERDLILKDQNRMVH